MKTRDRKGRLGWLTELSMRSGAIRHGCSLRYLIKATLRGEDRTWGGDQKSWLGTTNRDSMSVVLDNSRKSTEVGISGQEVPEGLYKEKTPNKHKRKIM